MPAFHAGRVHQLLPLPVALKSQGGKAGAGDIVIPGQARRANHQFRRAFDMGKAGLLKKVGIKQYPQDGLEVSPGIHIRLNQQVNGRRVVGRRDVPGRHLRLVGHKEVVEMAGQETGGVLLPDDDVNDVAAVEVAGMAQETLFPIVVVVGPELETPVETAQGLARRLGGNRPAGKGPGGFLDVLLGIMPHAHREQFQQFPAPVFVDGAVVIAVVVQPVNHGRALRQLRQQIGKSGQPLPAEHGNLLGQLRRIVHFGVAGGEQLMPEQGHLFLQGPTGVDHPIDPLGLGGHRGQGTLEVGKVADQVILVDARLRPRIQQFLDGGGIA